MEGIKGHASAISFFGGRIPACEPSTSKLCNGNNNKTFCFALTAQISYINRFRKNELHEYVFHFCQEVLSYGGKIVLFYTNKLLSNTVCIKLILQWIIFKSSNSRDVSERRVFGIRPIWLQNTDNKKTYNVCTVLLLMLQINKLVYIYTSPRKSSTCSERHKRERISLKKSLYKTYPNVRQLDIRYLSIASLNQFARFYPKGWPWPLTDIEKN